MFTSGLTLCTSVLHAMEHASSKQCPTLDCRYVYDGVLDAQFLTLHESASKRQRYSGDIYPHEVQLGKGDYTVRLMLRHDSHELLDKLKSLPLVMSRKLDSAGGPEASDDGMCVGLPSLACRWELCWSKCAVWC